MTVDQVEQRKKWHHRIGDEYVLICQNIITAGADFETVYSGPLTRYATHAQAQSAGFRVLDRSDDFNIGQMRKGRLLAMLWMDEVVDEDFALMGEISEQVGL